MVLVEVQSVLFDILDHACREEVLDTHAPTKEQANFRGGNIVVDHLADHINVVSPCTEGFKGFVDVRASSLDDKTAVTAQNMFQLDASCERRKGASDIINEERSTYIGT